MRNHLPPHPRRHPTTKQAVSITPIWARQEGHAGHSLSLCPIISRRKCADVIPLTAVTSPRRPQARNRARGMHRRAVHAGRNRNTDRIGLFHYACVLWRQWSKVTDHPDGPARAGRSVRLETRPVQRPASRHPESRYRRTMQCGAHHLGQKPPGMGIGHPSLPDTMPSTWVISGLIQTKSGSMSPSFSRNPSRKAVFNHTTCGAGNPRPGIIPLFSKHIPRTRSPRSSWSATRNRRNRRKDADQGQTQDGNPPHTRVRSNVSNFCIAA